VCLVNDTFRRIFSAINPKAFNACFIAFTQEIASDLHTQLIAIDGKTLHRSFDSTDEVKHIHLLSAYACEHGLSLAQLAVDEKSNEINAVPEFLDLLDIERHTISLDAMGCQKKIARQIHLAHGDYLLALKGNHPNLYSRLEQLFSDGDILQYTKEQGSCLSSSILENKGHGRLEKRIVVATNALG